MTAAPKPCNSSVYSPAMRTIVSDDHVPRQSLAACAATASAVAMQESVNTPQLCLDCRGTVKAAQAPITPKLAEVISLAKSG